MVTIDIPFSPVNLEERKKLDIRPGDTIRVWQRIKEGDKSRLQAFEGLVIARKHGREPGATFTVRKVTKGIGVERIFPLYSPSIEKIELISRSKVRRAKLYYIREKAAREMRKKMKKLQRVEKVMFEKQKEPAKDEEETKKE
ncbi:50S ribosomal protein L19 [Patescibacteria group bacterium]|nr:50S ribosomal protein L19 [Patescibacteria group bacterium]